MAKAQKETGFETLEIGGVIRFAFATKTHEEKLQKWAEARGMKAGELLGPEGPNDEVTLL